MEISLSPRHLRERWTAGSSVVMWLLLVVTCHRKTNKPYSENPEPIREESVSTNMQPTGDHLQQSENTEWTKATAPRPKKQQCSLDRTTSGIEKSTWRSKLERNGQRSIEILVQPSRDLHGIAAKWNPTTESHNDRWTSSPTLAKVSRGHRKLKRITHWIRKGTLNFIYNMNPVAPF